VELSRVVAQHLASLQAAGLTWVPRGTGRTWNLQPGGSLAAEEPPAPVVDQVRETAAYGTAATASAPVLPAPAPASSAPAPASSAPAPASRKPAVPVGDRAGALQVLADEVAGCQRCEELCRLRTQTVFGVGNPQARLVLLGEGPGEQEDLQGEPFVGAAGQLLDRILAACGLSRNDVYILNAVKCRPPRNRNPKPEELENCWEYGRRQLEILQPEFICCLGSVAARTLLQTNLSVGRLRRQFHQYRQSKVLVTYHPAYLLRTESAKKYAWEDMQMLMREMGIEIPSRS